MIVYTSMPLMTQLFSNSRSSAVLLLIIGIKEKQIKQIQFRYSEWP